MATDPSPDTPSVCPFCEIVAGRAPATIVRESSPDTATLVAELRGPSGLASTSRAKHLTVGVCTAAADALEAQAARIAELEADNRRLATTMTGDTAIDLRVLYAYELGLADHPQTTPAEETTE